LKKNSVAKKPGYNPKIDAKIKYPIKRLTRLIRILNKKDFLKEILFLLV